MAPGHAAEQREALDTYWFWLLCQLMEFKWRGSTGAVGGREADGTLGFLGWLGESPGLECRSRLWASKGGGSSLPCSLHQQPARKLSQQAAFSFVVCLWLMTVVNWKCGFKWNPFPKAVFFSEAVIIPSKKCFTSELSNIQSCLASFVSD